MDTTKIIKGVVGSGRYTVTAPIVKEDYGLYLQIEGVELPSTYEVDFSNSEHNGTSVTMIGNSDGVLIPHQFIDTGKDVFAFLYHVGADYGRTVYKFRIPNKVRPDRTDIQPTPAEQSTIDQLISALNTAVEQTGEDVESASQSAQSAEQSAQNAHTYALSANTASDTAENFADAASSYASQAEQAKDTAEVYVGAAKGYAEQADASATASANSALASAQRANASADSATQAQGYAQSASASAQSASGYASQAQTSAQTASSKATEASTSAQTASQKATEASQSATNAQTYASNAESAKTDAQTAQGLAESARDSAVQAKTDAESAKADAETARDEAVSAVASISGALAEKAPVITDTASGAIASFTDGADNLPLKSLVVDIDPVQDLHGQTNPYPAGGGKNLINFSDVTNRTYTNVYYADQKTDFQLVADVTYTLSMTINSSIAPLNISVGVGDDVTYRIDMFVKYNQSNGRIFITFTPTEANLATYNKLWFRVPRFGSAQTVTVSITDVQLELGSTATAWSPYENICPISGWTSVDVEQRGINVWDEEWEVGGINNSTGLIDYTSDRIRSANYIPILPNTTYYASIPSGALFVYFYDKDKNFITPRQQVANKAFTTPPNAFYMRWHTYDGSGATSQYGTTYNHDISINYHSTDHDYHPYTGSSLTISLGQTVYGGHLDVVSGVLTVDRANIASYNGETLPSTWISDRDVYASGTTPTTGAQVVYQLATPLEIQLTPQQVNSLLGVNNIWADSGDTEVEYRADTKLFIERLTAPDSADMIADANITSGQYFMVGNNLFKATANIANGSAIIVGTNCTRKSLSEALNEINA